MSSASMDILGHPSCLDYWRSTREGFTFSHHTKCRAVFILRANVPPDRWWLRFKFQLLVTRDHAFIFVIIVAFLGVLVYKFFRDELREMFGYEEHPYALYTMAVLAIVLVFPHDREFKDVVIEAEEMVWKIGLLEKTRLADGASGNATHFLHYIV
ncbi:E3 ubiquitin protein ligase MARCH8 [Tanacetum coccineum]|uniref:E3 ubiquitin protein ligase MARCH8 n=1 Tax=Tanacetum coccineum TaxID=301880 RepID=A0ABQ5E5P4_9ASTR